MTKKLDLYQIQWRTDMQKARLKSYTRYFEDPDKEKRIESQECVICYYGGKIGGAAMTNSNCICCEKQMMFGSTCVDNLCQPCAEKHGLCKHCNSTIDYKRKNKLNT